MTHQPTGTPGGPEDLAVLEDLEAQAVQAAPADHVILVKHQTQQLLRFLATRMYQQANCPQVYPVAQADPAVLEDQEAQVR